MPDTSAQRPCHCPLRTSSTIEVAARFNSPKNSAGSSSRNEIRSLEPGQRSLSGESRISRNRLLAGVKALVRVTELRAKKVQRIYLPIELMARSQISPLLTGLLFIRIPPSELGAVAESEFSIVGHLSRSCGAVVRETSGARSRAVPHSRSGFGQHRLTPTKLAPKISASPAVHPREREGPAATDHSFSYWSSYWSSGWSIRLESALGVGCDLKT